jgi:hypothetical protein
LNGNSFGIHVVNGGTTLRADDFTTNSPIVVPAGPSNLLQITVAASAGAGGSWGIYAVPGAGNTQFTSGGTPTDLFYSNVPTGGGNVQLAQFNVPVPEPAGVLAVAVAAGWVGNRFRRHVRSRK